MSNSHKFLSIRQMSLKMCMWQYFWVMRHMVCLSTNLRRRFWCLFGDFRKCRNFEPPNVLSRRRISMKNGVRHYLCIYVNILLLPGALHDDVDDCSKNRPQISPTVNFKRPLLSFYSTESAENLHVAIFLGGETHAVPFSEPEMLILTTFGRFSKMSKFRTPRTFFPDDRF